MKKLDKELIVQEYFAECREQHCKLDENRQLASDVFNGAIRYASLVFINRLMYGGAYETNKEDKMKILDLLRELNKILDKYAED